MKVFIVALIVSLAVVVIARPEEKYTTKFDNVNLDDILSSERLLKNYVNCLKGAGKCSPDASELKRLLPEALASDCNKCSEKQRDGSKKVISHLVNKKPELWNELKALYDPTGKFTEKYAQEYKLSL